MRSHSSSSSMEGLANHLSKDSQEYHQASDQSESLTPNLDDNQNKYLENDLDSHLQKEKNSQSDDLMVVIELNLESEGLSPQNTVKNVPLPPEKNEHSPLIPNQLIDIESDDDSQNHYDACCQKVRPLRPLLYFGPLSIAIKEAADIVMSLSHDKNSTKITLSIGAVTAFLSSMGLTGQTTKKNFNQSCLIVKKLKLPPNWPVLTPQKNIIAFVLGSIPSAYAIFSKGTETYFFVFALPQAYQVFQSLHQNAWKGISGLFAVGTGLTILLTEDMELFKSVRKYLAGEHRKYANLISQYLSPGIGNPLSLLRALQESVKSYIVITNTFSISHYAAICIAILSFGNTIPDFCFRSPIVIKFMDKFFNFIANKKNITPLRFFAFNTSLGLAIYLAYLQLCLNITFYQDILNDLKMNPEHSYYFIRALAGLVFIEESLLTTEIFNNPMYELLYKGKKLCKTIYHTFYDCFYGKPHAQTVDHPQETTIIPKIEQVKTKNTIEVSPEAQVMVYPPLFTPVTNKESSMDDLFPKLRFYQSNNHHLMFNQFRRIREKAENKELEQQKRLEENKVSNFCTIF